MHNCDGCTVCCKNMGVDELNKPRYTWCQHCEIGKGCNIYDTRPESCRVYECVWLKTQVLTKPIPFALRPDKSKVLIGTANNGEDLILYVSPDRSDAWKHSEFSKFVTSMKAKGISISVSCGNKIKHI